MGQQPSEQRIEVDEAASGGRLDRFLAERFPELGRAAVRRLIEAGQVLHRGRRARAGAQLQAGDALLLRDWPQGLSPEPDAALPLVLVHEDARLLVVDKPAGMASHPLRAGEGGTLASALLARYPELAGVGYSVREPGLLHRLDRDTSGLLLIARDAECFERLRALLAGGGLDKRYEALCAGAVRAPALHRAFLSARGPTVTVREEPFAQAQPIETELLHAEPAGSGWSLVELRVHFARRHQVRAHMAALGHAIAGDAAYGGAALPGLPRHYLHASALSFEHPFSGQRLSLRAPRPPELQAALDALRDTP